MVLDTLQIAVTFASTNVDRFVTEVKVMSDGKFVSYLRVSTAQQGTSGLGLEAQRSAVAAYMNSKGGALVREVIEVESGKWNERPSLAVALDTCKRKNAVLVIAKLDRLARNVAFIANLMETGVEFVAADRPNADRFELHLYAAFAEKEGKDISQRTKAALAASKIRREESKKLAPELVLPPLGGRRMSAEAFAKIAVKGREVSAKLRTLNATTWAGDRRKDIADIQAGGVMSLRVIAQALNKEGVQTARGGKWSATQVQRVLARA